MVTHEQQTEKTALIVEDDKAVLQLIRLYLAQAGYRILEAQDGVAGLRMALEESPDIVLLDGTFWSNGELARQAEVPHPPVAETLERLGAWRKGDPRIVFIHLNHTNPLCNPDSGASAELARSGWEVGREGQTFSI